MDLKITDAINGFILKYDDELDDGTITKRQVVFETKTETGGEDKNHLVEMLYYILEYYGEIYEKYGKENIHISLTHGHKYECKNKHCPICKEE